MNSVRALMGARTRFHCGETLVIVRRSAVLASGVHPPEVGERFLGAHKLATMEESRLCKLLGTGHYEVGSDGGSSTSGNWAFFEVGSDGGSPIVDASLEPHVVKLAAMEEARSCLGTARY